MKRSLPFALLLLGACTASTGDDGADTNASAVVEACPPPPRCDDDVAPPPAPPSRSFRHITSRVIVHLGMVNHRARDILTVPGAQEVAIAKFAYGLTDKDLHDEDVDVFLMRGCTGAWTALGTARTTDDGAHPPVDGVNDDGGRVYFPLPEPLPLGRHRLRFVVRGDGTSTDALVDVVSKDQPLVVSDVDGTLTESENAEFPALLKRKLPAAHPDAAKALAALAARGYTPVYVTARAEWLGGRTHDFLRTNGFPAGVVRTTTSLVGYTNDDAKRYKIAELRRLTARGPRIAWAIGNRESDTQTYDALGVEPREQRIFYRQSDAFGGRRIEAYADLLPAVFATPSVCRTAP